MRTKTVLGALAVLALLVGLTGAYVHNQTQSSPARIWTPAPVSGAPLLATRPVEILPTLPPVTVRPTLLAPGPTARPIATPFPTQGPAPEPTFDPHRVVITEADVLNAISSGATGQQGLLVENAAVRFIPDRMIFSATRLSYGPIEVRNLVLTGRLQVREGRLYLDTESITPSGLVTVLIPTVANQALAQYTSQWYIEEARMLDGRLELRVR
ncbi:MAG: hypothetical protein N2204_00140 [Anaerolineae bacterium]|nr:hypothetical protein [Anaerolineae bacterium]